MNQQPENRHLSFFALLMITIIVVVSLRNLTMLSFLGDNLIYFLLIGAVVFLVPVAWVSAELASIWSEKGDLYLWVKKAFGPRVGFLAAWFRWAHSVILYPLILSFLASCLAFIIAPYSTTNKYYLFLAIVSLFSFLSYLHYHGFKVSTWFSIYCGSVGVLLPVIILFIMAGVWFFNNSYLELNLFHTNMFAELSCSSAWVNFSIVFLAFSGVEVAASRIGKSVKRRSIISTVLFWACVLIVVTLILGALACLMIFKTENLNVISGFMQVAEFYFAGQDMIWLTPVFALFVVLGALGAVANWMLTATKGLFRTSADGCLPPKLQRESRHGSPKSILLIQVILVILFSSLFLWLPSVEDAFFLLSIIAIQLYLVAYVLLFAAAIRVRYKYPYAQPKVRVIGGKIGIWLVAGIGFLATIAGLIASFMVPYGYHGGFQYYGFMIIGLVIFILLVILICLGRRPSWKLYAEAKALARY